MNDKLGNDFLVAREVYKPIIDLLKAVDINLVTDLVERHRVELARKFDSHAEDLTLKLAEIRKIGDEMRKLRVKMSCVRPHRLKKLNADGEAMRLRAVKLLAEFEKAEREFIAIGKKFIAAQRPVVSHQSEIPS